MSKEKTSKDPKTSKDLPLKEDPSFEQKKRAAYSAMGKLGGLARAKQMAEKGFAKSHDLKSEKNKKK